MNLYFPFGNVLEKIVQTDRSPKKNFVLGVYGSAVHAKWVGLDGRPKVAALAVASEPEIFWQGDNADRIISKIKIPEELGFLKVPDNQNLNGPTGKTLDSHYLHPLKTNRNETWLCDLIPESRLNDQQQRAISNFYTDEKIRKFKLKPVTIPLFRKKELNSEKRAKEILFELEESKAERIILLGDLPIRYFLYFFDSRYKRLAQFGENQKSYGEEHIFKINGKLYKVIPLCHPRQSNKLGVSNSNWTNLHLRWSEIKKLI